MISDADLDAGRDAIDELEHALRELVSAACPGTHVPVQHRDRKSPWCPACGRDARGARQIPCPTCTGPSRETTGLVCQTCGTDYGRTS